MSLILFGHPAWEIARAIFLLSIPVSFVLAFVSWFSSFRKDHDASPEELFYTWFGGVMMSFFSFGLLALALWVISWVMTLLKALKRM